MGRNIYFTNKEICALRDTSGEWTEMMQSGDKNSKACVEERLDNGLGSALRKLYKGSGCEAYKDYR